MQTEEQKREERLNALGTLCSFIAFHEPMHMMGGTTAKDALKALSTFTGLPVQEIERIAFLGKTRIEYLESKGM